eukprot:g11229.t1
MQSSVPALTPQHPTDSSSRAATGGSRKVQEQVGSYIKKLVGDEAGDGMLHWRLEVQDNLERDRAAEQKALQRTVLEEQVREARKKDHDFKSSRMHWGSKIQADAAQWQEEERLKKIRQQETLRKFNEEQARHAEASRRRKDAEAQEVAQLEHAMAQQAADAKRQQELAEEQRRKKQQDMAGAQDRMSWLHKKSQERFDVNCWSYKDIAMMKAQIAVMEAQEQQRAQSFQRMKEKQGKAQAQYEAKAGSEQARLQKEDGSTRRSTEWAVWPNQLNPSCRVASPSHFGQGKISHTVFVAATFVLTRTRGGLARRAQPEPKAPPKTKKGKSKRKPEFDASKESSNERETFGIRF